MDLLKTHNLDVGKNDLVKWDYGREKSNWRNQDIEQAGP